MAGKGFKRDANGQVARVGHRMEGRKDVIMHIMS